MLASSGADSRSQEHASPDCAISASGGGSHVDALRNEAVKNGATATSLLGRRPTGMSVAMPIRIEATDADLASSRLQYYLIAEIAAPKIMERMQELDATRMKQIAEAKAAEAARQSKEGTATSADQSAALLHRIEVLESRVDLLTRQLNELLKELDK
jgi:hypothetical protein